IARSQADAPEIDGLVYLNGESDLKPGQRLMVNIEHADEHDLWGTPVPVGH
ncbi:MAG TPA: 30S ribosomal protein S12 methylthiotransferase RimO, partial [Alcanivorax sp.]|nr:30S ribosomal protein S12 methylthiotransferase RimO [Alcanivorax sp.]